ncbi:Maf family nucleotide pyrophosphatase [Maribacter sp. 2307ULW6-5]|uniref:Maf family nucleotide pyrophosphatase n=1 Tax=Maribacter sp. 2307ULW6-5 TaxID=3386275 RepID=UPI0039BC5F1A
MNTSGFKLVLASESPRRQDLMRQMGLDFEVRTVPVRESYPTHLQGAAISDFLAVLKASAQQEHLLPNEILISADTVVWQDGTSLAKPANPQEAAQMLRRLSGKWHQVITSVCFTTTRSQNVVHAVTEVQFRKLKDTEMAHYIATCQPFDKAGGYGIQEWIGLVGIEQIKGSYTNVVGLPTHLVHKTLMEMTGGAR